MVYDYIALADELEADISDGRLRPGDKLPPQRQFAFTRHIAASTASRVYTELRRRGLVSGEVGRGTFVAQFKVADQQLLSGPPYAPVDLQFVRPRLEADLAAVSEALADIAKSLTFVDSLAPVGPTGSSAARVAMAGFLERSDWKVSSNNLLFAGGGRQAIAACLGALGKPGDRVGVESLTYPYVKTVAQRLGLTIVPIEIDEQGMVPAALISAHQAKKLSAIYIQPSIHSPTGATMGAERRGGIASVLEQLDLVAIEDGVYSFLSDHRPLAAIAPENVINVDSFSKRVGAGLPLGIIVAPDRLVGPVATSLRSGAWTAAALPMAVALRLVVDGGAKRLGEAKRVDARARQQLAKQTLHGIKVDGDENAYHLWLRLPEAWRADAFAAEALRLGIALTPGSAFAVTPGHIPNAVRLALASPDMPSMIKAIDTLTRLVGQGEALESTE